MKKFFSIFVLALVALCTLQANAETRWGVTMAGNYNFMKFNQDIIDVDNKFGGSVGLMGELMIPGIGFGVDASLLYTMRNADLHMGDHKVWSSDGYGLETYTSHNISIPLNLKFRYTNLNGLENIIAPIVYGGPEFTFPVSSTLKDAFSNNFIEFSLHAGLGCELYKHIQVRAEYRWGITDATSTKKLDGYAVHNQGIQLGVTYMF